MATELEVLTRSSTLKKNTRHYPELLTGMSIPTSPGTKIYYQDRRIGEIAGWCRVCGPEGMFVADLRSE